MNLTNDHAEPNETKCCNNYCNTMFDVESQESVNNHKCNQKHFSVTDLWSIEKQKRKVSIRRGIGIN